MKTTLLAVVMLLLGFAMGLYLASGSLLSVYAQSPETYSLEPSWGSVKGTMGNRMLVLEDESGVIRIVDLGKFNLTTKKLEAERIINRQ